MEIVQSLKKGDRIRLLLHTNRKIECDFVLGDSNGISATNCFDSTTKKLRKTIQKFYRSDIKSIENSKQQESQQPEQAIVTSNGEHVEPNASSGPCDKQRFKKVFSQTEIEQINWLVDNAVYITQRNDSYIEAITSLKCQDCIGFHVEIQSSIGTEDVFLMTFSTTKKVFTFNVSQCNKMFLELKDILETYQVKKIVFDAPAIGAYFRQNGHELKLSGIIDVMVTLFDCFTFCKLL